ncbi:MAG: hypothetical protein JW867_02985 [Candidatus Omnitrophica bacterium]|nr:hypothetical protein [Candidatus Omnitrophota bacterium]
MAIDSLASLKGAEPIPYIDWFHVENISGAHRPETIISDLLGILSEKNSFSLKGRDPCNTGLFLGTSLSNFHIRNDNFQKFSLKGLRVMNPADAPKGLISYIGGQLSIELDIKGMQSTVSTYSSQGFDALYLSLQYLRRNINNCAIVIELDEYIQEGPECSARRACVLVLKNSLPADQNLLELRVAGMESFFERQSQTRGLIRALKALIFRHNLDQEKIGSVYCSAGHNKLQVSLLKEDLSSADLLNNYLLTRNSLYDFGESGLFLISHILKQGFLKDSRYRARDLILILHLGFQTNSSCLALEVKKRGEGDE